MSEPFPELNRLIHEPARLSILTVLSACEGADFVFLQSATGLSKGNLSIQMSRLEEGRLIRVKKTIQYKRTLTTASLTNKGRHDLSEYWQMMERVRKRSGRR